MATEGLVLAADVVLDDACRESMLDFAEQHFDAADLPKKVLILVFNTEVYEGTPENRVRTLATNCVTAGISSLWEGEAPFVAMLGRFPILYRTRRFEGDRARVIIRGHGPIFTIEEIEGG